MFGTDLALKEIMDNEINSRDKDTVSWYDIARHSLLSVGFLQLQHIHPPEQQNLWCLSEGEC